MKEEKEEKNTHISSLYKMCTSALNNEHYKKNENENKINAKSIN